MSIMDYFLQYIDYYKNQILLLQDSKFKDACLDIRG